MMEKFIDTTLTCVECSANFVFEANEARYYYARRLRTPKRCPACRERRKITIDPPPRGDEIAPIQPDQITVEVTGGTYTGWDGS